MTKQNVLLLCGGQSSEHEVSLNSARNVLNAIDRTKYSPTLLVLSKDSGSWFHVTDFNLFSTLTTAVDTHFNLDQRVFLTKTQNGTLLQNNTLSLGQMVDVVLPILHGKYGEDGCLQGMCRMLNLPFVGPAVAASATCMDKDFTKRILHSAGVPIGPYRTLYKGETLPSFLEITQELGLPFFIKPANTGSSVGVYKIKSEADFQKYLPIVFAYDHKIVLETFIKGREIECAVLGNESPIASGLGEIKPTLDFYSYEAKYIDPNGAHLFIPADVPTHIAEKIQNYALQAYKVMGCEGMSRIDFFLTDTQEIYLNELNTIPGFTNISMYPKLFEQMGISYEALITRLIELALSAHTAWENLSTEHHLA